MNSTFFFQLKLRGFSFELLSEANLSFLSLQTSHEVNILFTKKTGKHALEREGKQTFTEEYQAQGFRSFLMSPYPALRVN